jgi:single-strand DNA-binding protein
MNKLTIIGNLTKDPELRHTQDGTPVCSFTVAVNRRKDGETDYFNTTAWRQLGENAAKFLSKGKKVAVVGRVSLRTWEKDGKHGASLEVQADDIEYLSPRVSDPETPTPPVDAKSGMTIADTDELPF